MSGFYQITELNKSEALSCWPLKIIRTRAFYQLTETIGLVLAFKNKGILLAGFSWVNLVSKLD